MADNQSGMGSVGGFDQALGDLQELAKPRTSGRFTVPEAQAEGESDNGLIRVVMKGGKVAEVAVHPSASTKMSNAELADAFKDAANAAIEAYATALTEALQGDADFGALNESLAKIRDQANESMRGVLNDMHAMMERATAGGPYVPPPSGGAR